MAIPEICVYSVRINAGHFKQGAIMIPLDVWMSVSAEINNPQNVWKVLFSVNNYFSKWYAFSLENNQNNCSHEHLPSIIGLSSEIGPLLHSLGSTSKTSSGPYTREEGFLLG